MTFRVPFGRTTTGELIAPEKSERGGAYACPACASALIVRGGADRKVVRHFAHKRSATCSAETVLHVLGKEAAKLAIERAIEGEPLILILECDTCREPYEQQVSGKSWDSAQIEHRVPSGRIVDVMALSGNEGAFAVEVLVTHAVDTDKSTALSVPWVEVKAQEILDRPYRWLALQQGGMNNTCWYCEAVRAEELRKQEARAIELQRLIAEQEARLTTARVFAETLDQYRAGSTNQQIALKAEEEHLDPKTRWKEGLIPLR